MFNDLTFKIFSSPVNNISSSQKKIGPYEAKHYMHACIKIHYSKVVIVITWTRHKIF